MFVDLNLEEDELNVLEYCVDTVLADWEKTYEESCKNPQIIKNPLAVELLGHSKEWITTMKSILKKIDPLKELIEKQ